MNSQPQNLNPYVPLQDLPRPMFKLALAFLAGILYARYFPLGLSPALALLFLLAMIWGTLARKEYSRHHHTFHWVMAMLLTFMLGGLRMEYLWLTWQKHQDQVAQRTSSHQQILHGQIIEKRSYDSGLQSLLISHVRLEQYARVHKLPILVELRGYQDQLAHALPGNTIQAEGWLIPVRGPDVPTSMDFQEYRYSQHVFASFHLPNNGQCTLQSQQSPTTARGFAHTLMRNVHQQWSSHPNDENIIGLIGSIAFGIRSQMPSELRSQLQTSGLAHITSISGLHVTLMLMLTFFLLKKLGFKRRQAGLIMALFALLYLHFVGIRIPTLRAVLMAFVGLGGMMLQRKADALNTLGLVALLILWADPAEAFLPSFQLSFTAVLVLILTQRWSSSIYKTFHTPYTQYTLNSLLASCAVVLGIAPFTIHYFHTFAWGAILANLVAIPILGLFLPLTYVFTLASAFSLPFLTEFFAALTHYSALLLLHVIQFFGSSPWFHITIPSPPTISLLFVFLGILLLFRPLIVVFQMRSLRIFSLHAALFLFFLAVSFPLVTAPFTPLRIDFLALGQGDCILIRTPNNHTMLIDGGPPRQKRDPSLLVDYLRAQGIDHIDAMLLTHPQSDHIGALEAVVRHFPVGIFLEGSPDPTHEDYQSLTNQLEQKQVSTHQVKKGHLIQLVPNINLWVLHPAYHLQHPTRDINEHSLVLLLQYRDFDLLLTGDIGASTERFLCQIYENWDVEVLKVAHHGSKNATTPEFLAETRPEFAVIQVGKNAYGHPHEETRYRLYDISAHVLRTDYDGSVQLRTWGSSLQIYTTRKNNLYKMKIPD